ncbi:MAG: hypothetical protein A2527_12660 [Candidatus Lambdaproteobacteria bacterium RIFOXYD2_FULL_50_16]|uniref:Transporter n=1 Tax=Candidatus Lambdaproteobacteria bacterium RIFOXYD2_FULL_50_16 TaxID=1817772 RepID=A0A1F6GA86_9PROT|nr:MAG: hypothetical protein A2527_12660 [Candidatus Lambdaproteobacteria bacterium RIFOXYD2_FULL_50_16]
MKPLVSLLFVLLWTFPSWAGPPPEGANLKQLIDYALAHNPGWQASQSGLAQERVKVEEAGGWPEPMLRLETWLAPQSQQWMYSQRLPLWGETGFNQEAARLEAEAAQYQHEANRRRLVRQVKATYYDLWLLSETPKLLTENQKTMERMAELGSFESQRNTDMLEGIFQAQAKIGENAFDLIKMQDQLLDAQVRLNSLLGINQGPLIQNLAEPPMPEFKADLTQLIEAARQTNPELLALNRGTEAAQQRGDLENRMRYLPRFELSLTYERAGMEGTGKDAYALGLGMNLPFFSSAQAGKAERAQLETLKQGQISAQRQLNLDQEVTLAYNRAQNSRRLVSVFEDQLLPPLKRSYQLAERLYGVGKKNMMTALKIKAQLVNMQIKDIQAKTEYLKALVELEELTGQRFD